MNREEIMSSIVLRWLPILLCCLALPSSYARNISASRNKNVWLQSQNASVSSIDNIPAIFQQNEDTSNIINRYELYRTNNLGFGGAFYGLQAKFSVWSFPVGASQQAMTSMDLVNGHGDELNILKVGWHIYPNLYGDYDPHFFVLWTADNFKNTGCFNLKCRGFVPSKNAASIPGAKLWPLSQYGGTQYYGHYKIFKDAHTGDWWVYEGANTYSNPVGYFPQNLFTNLANSASMILMGGLVCSFNNGVTPPMGSGHDSSEGYGKAADFEDIMFVDKSGKPQEPSFVNFVLASRSLKCYSASRMKVKNGKGSFYYGGPGNC